MPFPISVLDPFAFPDTTPRRVTLIRFARAVTGFADNEAPDIDDRGSTVRAGQGLSRGPVAGLIGNAVGVANQRARIRIIRDRVEATAQLFPELESSADVTIIHPPAGQPLSLVDVPATGATPAFFADCVHLESASAGAGNPETKLKIHFGSATGPVIAEMGVVVYEPKIMFVQVHTVTINGPANPTTPAPAAQRLTPAQIITIFQRMDKIYTQAGIRVVLRGTFLPETVDNYTEQGTVTLTAVADHLNIELQNILNQNPEPDSMNAYIFNQFRDVAPGALNPLGVVGVAFPRNAIDDVNNPPVGPFPAFPGTQAGFTLAARTDLNLAAHTAAHEIGHSLELTHYGGREPKIDEIWSNRNLMANLVNLFPPDGRAVANVGYGQFDSGSLRNGSWLGTKSITAASLSQGDQINLMRDAHRRNSFKPLVRP